MGLLDIFNSAEGQQALGLLAAGGARSDGAGFGQRLMEGVSAGDAWRAKQLALEEAKQKIAYQNALMQEHQQKLAMEKRAMEMAIAKQQALPQIFQQGSNGAPAMNMDSMLPPELRAGTPTVGAVPARQSGINVQRGLQAGYTPDELMKLDGLRNIGLDEVARTIDVEGAGGGKTVRGLDKFGRQVFDQNGYVAPVSINQGDRTTFVKPAPGVSLPTFQDPNSKASNAVAWANNAISRDRLNWDKSQADGPEKAPSGYRWNAGGTALETIPGGPAAQEKAMTDTQAKAFDFGGRMLQASKTLDALASNGVNRAIPGQNAGFGIGTALNATVVPADWQKLEQSKRQWINAALRRESGAVIGADEMANFDKTYFPQIGEGAEVIKQKADARRQVESGILADVPTAHLKKLGVFGNSGGASWEDAYKKYGG